MKRTKFILILFVFIISLSRCSFTYSPLLKAVNKNDIEKANQLIEQGADVNENKNKNKYTPLKLAAYKGYFEMAKLLIAKGANINENYNNTYYSPLVDAARFGNIDIVKLLLDKGADINLYFNDKSYTALYFAIYGNLPGSYNNNPVIQLLLKRGAKVYREHLQAADHNGAIEYETLKMLRETYTKSTISPEYSVGLLLAVIDFEPRGLSRGDAMRLSDWLRTELINTKQFTVIERNAMNEILKEQAFSLTGCTDTTCAAKVGKLLSARKMLVGTIELYDNKIFINGRIVDVEKGVAEIAHKETVNSIKELDKGAINFAKNLVRRANGLPVQ